MQIVLYQACTILLVFTEIFNQNMAFRKACPTPIGRDRECAYKNNNLELAFDFFTAKITNITKNT